MKKSIGRKTAHLFVCLMAVSMLMAACSSHQGTSAAAGVSGDTGQVTEETNEPYVITMLSPFFQQEPPSEKNNPVYDFVEKELNVDFQITWAPNGEVENKFNVLMASNDMMMVMDGGNASSSNFIRMADSGAFWDLTDIIKEYPLITETLWNPVIEQASLTHGRRYTLPTAVPDARIGLVYRADWVEKLGIELPEILSIQDFYNLAKAFTEDDPDENGKDDTTGFNYVDDADKEITYGFDCIAVGLGAPNRWGYRDGKMVPYFDTPEYMDTLKLLHDMYKNGYLNEEFATLGSGAKYNPMLQDRAGMMFTTATNSVSPGGKFDTLIATNPKTKISYKLLLLDPNGNKVINSNITGVTGGRVLTISKVKTEEDVRRILQVIVDINQGECAKAVDIGIEGIHYTKGSDGKITISDEQDNLRTNDGSRGIFMDLLPKRIVADDWGQTLSIVDKINQEFVDRQKYAVPDLSVSRMSSEDIRLENTLSPIISDARVQFIMGFIDENGFKKAVESWKDQGGQTIIDDLTETYNSTK